MNSPEAIASRAIHSSRRAISEAVVERQYARRPELRDRYGERGREKCVADTQQHLAHLSGALLASSPALFADYISWASGVLSVASVRTEDFRENLTSLRDVLDDRLTGGMAAVATSYVGSALGRLAESPPEVPSFLPRDGTFAGIAGEFLRLLLACDRHAAGRLILDAVDSGVPIRDVYLLVFQPCQREVGRLWQAGRITVAQEHYCTAATQVIMAQLAPRLFTGERNGPRAVVACVAGETHEVGPRMVADLLELGGWETIYLGGNVPLRGVVQTLAEHRADLLAISATMTTHLPAVIDLIAAVRAAPACSGVRVMVGGRLFDAEPGLWRRVGADGHTADGDQLCGIADALVSGRGRERAGAGAAGSSLRPPPDDRSPAPPRGLGDLYDEMGLLNNEVVALNRELARKNAEVERLHAEVSRHAHQLTEANQHKDEFLAVLGHELRSPLAPLRNALALLGPDDPDPETVGWARDIMGRQVRHMVRLVDDLLDLSRVMQGKLDLRTERCDLAAVVTAAVETARTVIDSRGHDLGISLPAEPLYLDADPTRLTQAVVNLLNNAAKYTDPGGRIDLTAVRDGAEAVVVVRDSGVGIAPGLLPRIFDPFTQEGRSLSRSQGGLGIGLTLVKKLVEMHDGSVSARSEGLGLGCEFMVRLPAPAVTAPAGPQGGRKSSGEVCRRRRILVVDDNVDATRALARLLEKLYGQEVRVAHDGPEALAVAAEFRPEVILLDIGLPGMDGNEVARQLRGRPEFERTLIVALTGWGQEEDLAKSREVGFDHHLVKPADPAIIRDLLITFEAASLGV